MEQAVNPYLIMIINAFFVGIGSAIGSSIGHKFLEKTKLKEIDLLVEDKLKLLIRKEKVKDNRKTKNKI